MSSERLPFSYEWCFYFAVAVFALLFGCDSGGNDDEDQDPVSIFTAADEITDLTGSSKVTAASFFQASSGDILMNEGESRSVLQIQTSGAPTVFTSQEEITDLTGEATARLGPLDQIFLGAQQGQLVAADSVSGFLIRLGTDGTPHVHATTAQVTAVTGAPEAQISLPRALTSNQIIAQDLVTGHILLFDNLGNPQTFVTVGELIPAAGVDLERSAVLQWVRGGATLSQYARFAGTLNIIRVELNGTLTRHVDQSAFEALFPDVTDPRLLSLAADPNSDGILALIGDGSQGVGIALVHSDGGVEVYVDEAALTELVGSGYNLTDVGVLIDSRPFAIDGGNTNILVFTSGGQPLILADESKISAAAGVEAPRLSLGVGLLNQAIIISEVTTGNLIQAR
jgi:hypothetical protein